MLKKCFFVTLCIIMLIPITADIGIISFAETARGTCGDDLTWTFNNGALTISGTGDMYDYSGDYTSYGERTTAPWGRYSVWSVVVEDSVTSIGDYAFYYSRSLRTIKIGDSVTSIGNCAFYFCDKVESINIPSSVTEIGSSAFFYCGDSPEIYISDLVAWCNIDFSDSSSNPFYHGGETVYINGQRLVNLVIPDSVTHIGDYAFVYSPIKSVTIPNSVTSIGDEAFYYCSSLADITIPNSVTQIGDSNFVYTKYFNTNENWVDKMLYIGKHLIYVSDNKSGACTVNQGTLTIADSAFAYAESISSVSIPSSVKRIGESTFKNCTSLKNVSIPDSVTSIAKDAFYACSSLTSITLPKKLKSLDEYVFYGCTSLKDVSIPDSVTTIGYGAFNSTAYYENADNWHNGSLYIGDFLVAAENSITGSCSINDGTVLIANGTFRGNDTVTSVTIPESVKIIGSGAFDGCDAISNVYYDGNRIQFENIEIRSYNTPILNAVKVYAKKILTKIAIASPPDKNVYYIGDTFNTSGLSLKLYYEDSTSQIITDGFSVDKFNSSTAGVKTVRVNYDNKVVDLNVSVKTPNITITEDKHYNLIAKTEPEGCSVNWKSSNTNVAIIDQAGKYTLKNAGSTVITASFIYNGKTYSSKYNITVSKSDEINKLTIEDMPLKTTYYVGDLINITGLKLKVEYENGESDVITSGIEVIGFDSTTTGTKQVKVRYCGVTVSFNVTVISPTIKLPVNSKNVGVGSSFSLKAVVDPIEGNVIYKSSDNTVATVNKNGRVETYAKGKVTITATFTYNDKQYSAQSVITVTDAPVYINPFADVKDNHWFAESVIYCVQKGYVTGMTEDRFAPNEKLTRAQFLTILAKFDGVELDDYKTINAGFSDVKNSHWYNGVVCWAVENEYTSGLSATTFGPNEYITRAQLARFFYVYSEKNGISISETENIKGYPDYSKVAEWAMQPVQWAVKMGLISGVIKNGSVYLDPNGTATRAQAVVMFKAFDSVA